MRSTLIGSILGLCALVAALPVAELAVQGGSKTRPSTTRDVDANDDDGIVYTLWEAHPDSKKKRQVHSDANDDDGIVYTLWEAHPDSKKREVQADANDDDGIVYTLWEAHPGSKKD